MTHTGNYTEIKIPLPEPWEGERLAYLLAGAGFEGFITDDTELTAYIPSDQWDEALLEDITYAGGQPLTYNVRILPPVNWNEQWEKHFSPVTIDGRIHIRAGFHKPAPPGLLEIVITPKMSFGTGHHETTELMARLLSQTALDGRSLIDMGSGTGILAILACKTCARDITAIDIDRWAYENMRENFARNGCDRIRALQGGAEVLRNLAPADVFLANINRNIILQDLPVYETQVKPGGRLMLSGFYEEDLPHIEARLDRKHWRRGRQLTKNGWIGIEFVRL